MAQFEEGNFVRYGSLRRPRSDSISSTASGRSLRRSHGSSQDGSTLEQRTKNAAFREPLNARHAKLWRDLRDKEIFAQLFDQELMTELLALYEELQISFEYILRVIFATMYLYWAVVAVGDPETVMTLIDSLVEKMMAGEELAQASEEIAFYGIPSALTTLLQGALISQGLEKLDFILLANEVYAATQESSSPEANNLECQVFLAKARDLLQKIQPSGPFIFEEAWLDPEDAPTSYNLRHNKTLAEDLGETAMGHWFIVADDHLLETLFTQGTSHVKHSSVYGQIILKMRTLFVVGTYGEQQQMKRGSPLSLTLTMCTFILMTSADANLLHKTINRMMLLICMALEKEQERKRNNIFHLLPFYLRELSSLLTNYVKQDLQCTYERLRGCYHTVQVVHCVHGQLLCQLLLLHHLHLKKYGKVLNCHPMKVRLSDKPTTATLIITELLDVNCHDEVDDQLRTIPPKNVNLSKHTPDTQKVADLFAKHDMIALASKRTVMHSFLSASKCSSFMPEHCSRLIICCIFMLAYTETESIANLQNLVEETVANAKNRKRQLEHANASPILNKTLGMLHASVLLELSGGADEANKSHRILEMIMEQSKLVEGTWQYQRKDMERLLAVLDVAAVSESALTSCFVFERWTWRPYSADEAEESALKLPVASHEPLKKVLTVCLLSEASRDNNFNVDAFKVATADLQRMMESTEFVAECAQTDTNWLKRLLSKFFITALEATQLDLVLEAITCAMKTIVCYSIHAHATQSSPGQTYLLVRYLRLIYLVLTHTEHEMEALLKFLKRVYRQEAAFETFHGRLLLQLVLLHLLHFKITGKLAEDHPRGWKLGETREESSRKLRNLFKKLMQCTP